MNNNGILAVTVQYEEHDMFETSFRVREIGKGLHHLQAFVGGYIEIPYISEELSSRNISVIINEEGKLQGLRPTIAIMVGDKIVDTLNGNVIFASYDTEKEEFVSLSSEQVSFVSNYIRGDSLVYHDENGCSIIYAIQLKSGE